MSHAPAIETAGLTKELESQFLRKRFRVLDGVNISVNKGETYGLLGLNGAGKTTTLKLMLGLMRPTKGTVTILGAPAGTKSVLARLGFLPENPYFYSHLTGRECLDFIGSLFGMDAKKRQQKTRELLELVQMNESADVAMRKYSKGMLQRIGIAQSLINEPDILFLDEPMSGLDIIGRRDMRDILKKMKAEGRTIFFNSHLLPDVNEVCDRVGILHNGRMLSQTALKDISTTGEYKDLENFFLAELQTAGVPGAAGAN
jgi:ABC-2 type transport system ATP-binding protein